MTTAQEIITALNENFTATLTAAANAGFDAIEENPELAQEVLTYLHTLDADNPADMIMEFASTFTGKFGTAHDAMVMFGMASVLTMHVFESKAA